MSKIKITFPDGAVKEFDKSVTGYQIAQLISNRLAEEVLAVKFNNTVQDLHRTITEDGTVKFLTFDDLEGKEVYWHSSSHLMAHAVQNMFPEAKFGVGPAIDAGFYYDIDINTQLSEDHLKIIEDKVWKPNNGTKHFLKITQKRMTKNHSHKVLLVSVILLSWN